MNNWYGFIIYLKTHSLEVSIKTLVIYVIIKFSKYWYENTQTFDYFGSLHNTVINDIATLMGLIL